MSGPLRVTAAVLLTLGCAAWALGPQRSRVVRPRLGVPAVLAPGDAFELELERALPFGALEPRVELEREGAAPLTLSPRATERVGRRLRFAVDVPEDLPEGAYALVVHDGERAQRLPKAVHVREVWPDELCLVQMADLPEFFPDGSGTRAMDAMVDEVNVVAPDLVLITGDVAYGGSRDRYERLLVALERFDAPVVLVIGNHEFEGLAGYMDHLRVPRHVVDAGPLRVVSLNTSHGRDQFTSEQIDWLAEALAGVGGRTPIVQLHHPVFEDRQLGARAGRFAALCRAAEVPIVLSGHWHADRTFDSAGLDHRDGPRFDGPVFSITTAAGAMLHPDMSSGGSYHGYRVVRLAREAPGGRYRLRQYTYDLDGDGTPDPSASHPAGGLHVEHPEPGRVHVVNDWNDAVPRAHVWVDLPPGGTCTRVEGGREVARGPRGVAVELDLAPNSSADVRLVP